MSELVETWKINHRIVLFLLNAVSQEHLSDQAPSKGRRVGEQFAHIHNVRLMWLKSASPDLLEGLEKLEGEASLDKGRVAGALEASGEAIAKMVEQGLETGRIKGFKPHPTAFVGYLISHESHHRGQIILTLKMSGHMIDKKIQFGLWEWGTR